MKSTSKKIVKVLLILTLTVSTVVGLNPSVVFAAGAGHYSLYFNSPSGTNVTSTVLETVYYGGVNYFTVDSLSGSSSVKIVTCTGVNVNMSTIQMTSTGTTSFTCVPQNTGQSNVKFKITLINDSVSTAYASGRLYY